jgi:C1A family cysteine protease
MKHRHLSAFLFLGLIASTAVKAEQKNLSIIGSIPAQLQIQPTVKRGLEIATPQFKQISLQKIQLSTQATQYLIKHKSKPLVDLIPASSSSSKVQLGMNNVPVLDQGAHGTCVTFADTAAINAVLGKGDYISQLCNLELGSTLEQLAGTDEQGQPKYPSGWDGSNNSYVLKQINDYGIVNKTYQKQKGCGDKNETAYPLTDENNIGIPMSVEKFTSISEATTESVYTKDLLRIEDSFSETTDMEVVLKNVKTALASGHRVVFGTLVDLNDDFQYIMGALGTYNNIKNNSWVYTPKIMNDIIANVNAQLPVAGHAMIITGFDDNAYIVGARGEKHKGVLTLRNSWGEEVGDEGNYYMSYDYFTQLVDEVIEISPTKV